MIRPIFWLLLLAVLVAATAALTSGLLSPSPQAPAPAPGTGTGGRGDEEETLRLLRELERGHWLLGPGALSASARVLSSSSEGEPPPTASQRLFLLGLHTEDFQGLIVASLDGEGEGGERWLRRGEELYRFVPSEGKVVPVEDPAERRAPFLGGALTVEEVLFGFGLTRFYRPVSRPQEQAQGEGEGERLLLELEAIPAPAAEAPYARLRLTLSPIQPEAPPRLSRLEAYDRRGERVKTVEVRAYVEGNGLLLPAQVRVVAWNRGVQTEIAVEGRKAHALPAFAFTPGTLKGLEIRSP